MSNLRDKAREIKAAGEAERGNFEPSGAPLRLYNYWLERSNSDRAKGVRRGTQRENFCHFWRVVAIWAPLMFLRKKFVQVVEHPATLVLLGAAAIGALIFGGMTSSSFLTFLIWMGIGLVAAAAVVALVLYVKSIWRDSWTSGLSKAVPYFAGALAIAYVVFLLVIGFIELGWMLIPWVLGLGAAAVVVIATVAFIGSKLSDFIAGRRKMRRDAEEARIDAAYERGEDPFEVPAREPSRIQRFFSAVGDFIVLIAQVVRVNKWKICPMVDISK